MKKGITFIEVLVIVAIVIILSITVFSSTQKAHACGFWTDCEPAQNEMKNAKEIQDKLVSSVPVPQITNSLERENIAKRAEIFNKTDKLSYIYLISYGKVMAYYTVKGKVSSLGSYMTPTEKLVYGGGGACDNWENAENPCHEVSAPDIDGTYGENVEGIFFFTTEGAYVEWKGDYMMSDQPLRLSTQPELVRIIK